MLINADMFLCLIPVKPIHLTTKSSQFFECAYALLNRAALVSPPANRQFEKYLLIFIQIRHNRPSFLVFYIKDFS